MRRTMTYNQFMEHVLKHLEDYKRDVLGIEVKGIYKYQGMEIPKGYILPLDKQAKKQAVEEFNQLECIKEKPFLIAEHLHRYAHHLNSSQLMCYNFFRPYIERPRDAGDKPNQDLIDLLVSHDVNISLCDNAKCQFEYVNDEPEWRDEGTNFDFYIESGKTKIYFEIKYTEQGFGGCEKDVNHENKFEGNYKGFKGGYKEKIVNCPAIKEDMKHGIKFDDDFRKNYQLFRNVIRVINKKTYAVFIYDARNYSIVTQFENFRDSYISDEYKKNVIAITWQKLVENLESCHIKQFRKKYLG